MTHSEKFKIIMDKINKLTPEDIERINEELSRNPSLDKLKSGDYDLDKFFNEIMIIEGNISNESIAYFPEKYTDIFSNPQLELDTISLLIRNTTDEIRYYNPPFYQDSYFGEDIYFKYNGELYKYYYMRGQGTIEGITTHYLDEDRKVEYCLNLNNKTVEKI